MNNTFGMRSILSVLLFIGVIFGGLAQNFTIVFDQSDAEPYVEDVYEFTDLVGDPDKTGFSDFDLEDAEAVTVIRTGNLTFKLNTIDINVDNGAGVTFQAFLSGVQQGTDFAHTAIGAQTGVALPANFGNVDEIRITNLGGGTSVFLDNADFDPADANTPPVSTAPSAPTVNEDDTNVALADDIDITDTDGDSQTLTFTITGGTVTLGTTSIVFGGGGNGSAGFTASGSIADLNTALDAATFTPTPGLSGVNAGTIEFISNDGTTDGNTTSVTFDIVATPCAAPTAQATSPVFGTETTTTLDLTSWTAPAGGATGYVVIMNTSASFTTPTDGTLPTANTVYGSGEQVIYSSTSSTANVTVTGLTSSTTYHFQIFSYNDCSGTETYEGTGLAASDATATPAAPPVISSVVVSSDNSYADITFSVPVYNTNGGSGALEVADFVPGLTGGTAVTPIISAVRQNDGATSGAASALAGGETVIRAFFSFTGTADGAEVLDVDLFDGASVYEASGVAAVADQTTNNTDNLQDETNPTVNNILRNTPSTELTNSNDVVFYVDFSEAVLGVTSNDFTITGSAAGDGSFGTIASVDGDTWSVQIIGLTTSDGTIGLDPVTGQDLTDAGLNGLASATVSGTEESYTIDNTVPADPAGLDLDAGSDLGVSTTDNLTNDDTPTITGTKEANTSIEIFSDQDGPLGTVTLDGSTSWTFTTGALTGNLTHAITAVATDAAGNSSSAVGGLSIVLDTSAPTITDITSLDTDRDGDIDEVEIEFSEDIVDADFTGGDLSDWTVTLTGTDAITTFSSTVDDIVATDADANDEYVTLSFTPSNVEGTAQANYVYNNDGGDDIRDHAGNVLQNIASASTTDGAPPIVLSATAVDVNNSFVDITFSEGLYTFGGGPVVVGDFETLNLSGVSSVTIDNILDAADGVSALSGGEDEIRFEITASGDGGAGDTFEIRPFDNTPFTAGDVDNLFTGHSNEASGNLTLNTATFVSFIAEVAPDNSYVILTFSESVDRQDGGANPLRYRFNREIYTSTFTQNGGNATGITINNQDPLNDELDAGQSSGSVWKVDIASISGGSPTGEETFLIGPPDDTGSLGNTSSIANSIEIWGNDGTGTVPRGTTVTVSLADETANDFADAVATAYDDNDDGDIDRLTVVFDDAVEDATVVVADFAFGTATLSFNSANTSDGDAGVTDDNAITFIVTGYSGTGVSDNLEFTTGNLADDARLTSYQGNGASSGNAFANTASGGAITVVDAAPPRLVVSDPIITQDLAGHPSDPTATRDGEIDNIQISFTEPIANADVSDFTIGGYAIASVTTEDNFVNVILTQSGGYDTDATPLVTITSVADAFEDAGGNDFAGISTNAEDKVGPFAQVQDDDDDADGDGYFDDYPNTNFGSLDINIQGTVDPTASLVFVQVDGNGAVSIPSAGEWDVNLSVSDVGDFDVEVTTFDGNGNTGSDPFSAVSNISLDEINISSSNTVLITEFSAPIVCEGEYVSLGSLVITEQDNANFGIQGEGGGTGDDTFMMLQLPTGFFFDTDIDPNTGLIVTGGDVVAYANYVGNAILQLNFEVTTTSAIDVLTVAGLMVTATDESALDGTPVDIVRFAGDADIFGASTNGQVFGTVAPYDAPDRITDIGQSKPVRRRIDNTIAYNVTSGTTINWYDTNGNLVYTGATPDETSFAENTFVDHDGGGVTFVVGEIVYGQTYGASGIVVNDDGTTLEMNSVQGYFSVGEELLGTTSAIPAVSATNVNSGYDISIPGLYQFFVADDNGDCESEWTSFKVLLNDDDDPNTTSLTHNGTSTSFSTNEIITGGTSGATGTVSSISGSTIELVNVAGVFELAEVISGNVGLNNQTILSIQTDQSFITRTYNETDGVDDIYISNPDGHTVTVTSTGAGLSISDGAANPLHVQFNPATAGVGTYNVTYNIVNNTTGESANIVRTFEVQPAATLFTGGPATEYCPEDALVALNVDASEFDPTWGNLPYLDHIEIHGNRHNGYRYYLFGLDLHDGVTFYPVSGVYEFTFDPLDYSVPNGDFENIYFVSWIFDSDNNYRIDAEEYFIIYGNPSVSLSGVSANDQFCSDEDQVQILRTVDYVTSINTADPSNPLATYDSDPDDDPITNGYTLRRHNGIMYVDIATLATDYFDPNNPDQDGNVGEATDFGLFQIYYETEGLGPESCVGSTTINISVSEQPTMSVLDAATQASGSSIDFVNTDEYLLEFCEGDVISVFGVDVEFANLYYERTATVAYSSLVNTFNGLITGSTSGATGRLSTDGSGTMNLVNTEGDFLVGEVITGSISGKAVVSSYTNTTASTVSFSPGETIYGMSSGAYADVSFDSGGNLELTNIFGTFSIGETIQNHLMSPTNSHTARLYVPDVTWYDADTDTDIFANSVSSITPGSAGLNVIAGRFASAETVEIWVSTTSDGGCESPRRKVTITVHPEAETPVTDITGWPTEVTSGTTTTFDYCIPLGSSVSPADIQFDPITLDEETYTISVYYRDIFSGELYFADVSGVAGTFAFGEPVLGGTSGAQAYVHEYNSADGLLVLWDPYSSFTPGPESFVNESISGLTSGASADIDSFGDAVISDDNLYEPFDIYPIGYIYDGAIPTPFSEGETILGASSGATAQVYHNYFTSYIFVRYTSVTEFEQGEIVTGLTSGSTLTVNNFYDYTPSYDYTAYRTSNINTDASTSTFAGCGGPSAVVRMNGYPEPTALTKDNLSSGSLEIHTSEGVALDNISHTFTDGTDYYWWYEESGLINTIGTDSLVNGTPMTQTLLSAGKTDGDKQLEVGGSPVVVQDRDDDGMNDVYTYFVTRADNTIATRGFDGCESATGTAVTLTVHAKQDPPAITSDNAKSAILVSNFTDQGVDGDLDHTYSLCTDQVGEDELQFDITNTSGFSPSRLASIEYNLVSGAFTLGEEIIGASGAVGTIVGDDGTSFLLEYVSGTFVSTEEINGQESNASGTVGASALHTDNAIYLNYSDATGAFNVNPGAETVTGLSSDATGTAIGGQGSFLIVNSITGIFSPGETLEGGTTGVTALIDNVGNQTRQYQWYSYNNSTQTRGSTVLYTGANADFGSLGLSSIASSATRYFEVLALTDIDQFEGVESETTLIRVQISDQDALVFEDSGSNPLTSGTEYCSEDGTLDIVLQAGGSDANPSDLAYYVISGIDGGAQSDIYGSDGARISGNPTIDFDQWHEDAGGNAPNMAGDVIGGPVTSHQIVMFYTDPVTDCEGQISLTFNVNPLPDISFTVGGIDVEDLSFATLYNEYCYDDGNLVLEGTFSDGTPLTRLVGGTFTSSVSGTTTMTTNNNKATFDPSVEHDEAHGGGSSPYENQSSHVLTFTYEDEFGCTNQVSSTIYVNPTPEAIGTTNTDEIRFNEICEGQDASAFIRMTTDGSTEVSSYAGYTFNWVVNGTDYGTVAGDNESPDITDVNNNLNFSVTVTDPSQCEEVFTETHQRQPIPTLNIVGINDLDEFCTTEDGSEPVLSLTDDGAATSATNIQSWTVRSYATDNIDTVSYVDAAWQDVVVASSTGGTMPQIDISTWHENATLGGTTIGGNSTVHSIYITYQDPSRTYQSTATLCEATIVETIIINPQPEIDFIVNTFADAYGSYTVDAGYTDHFCYENGFVSLQGILRDGSGNPINLPAGTGTFSGVGIVPTGNGLASWNPQTANGNDPYNLNTAGVDITFAFTDGNGCQNSVVRTLYVDPTPDPVEVATGSPEDGTQIQFAQICADSPIEAFVQIVDPSNSLVITDYTNYEFDWTVGNSLAGSVVEGVTPTTKNRVTFNSTITNGSSNKDFTIEVVVTRADDSGNGQECLIEIEEIHEIQGLPLLTFNGVSDGDQYCQEDTDIGFTMNTDAGVIGVAASTDISNLDFSVYSYRDDMGYGSGSVIASGTAMNPTIDMSQWHLDAGGSEVGGYHTVHEITMTYQDLTDNSYQGLLTNCSATTVATISIYPDPALSFTVNSVNVEAGGFVGDVPGDVTSAPNHFCYDDPAISLVGVFGAATASIPGYSIGSQLGAFTTSAPGGTIVTTGTNTATFNPATAHGGDPFAARSSHTITFTYTDEYGCQNDVTETVYVNPQPDPIEVVGGSEVGDQVRFSAICVESDITAYVEVDDPALYTYAWNLPFDASSDTYLDNTVTYTSSILNSTANKNFQIGVTITEINTGCAFTIAPETHTQQSLPALSFDNVSDGDIFCANDPSDADGMDLSMIMSNNSIVIDALIANGGTSDLNDIEDLSYVITSSPTDFDDSNILDDTGSGGDGIGNPLIDMSEWHELAGGTLVGGDPTFHTIEMTYTDNNDNVYQNLNTSCSNIATITIAIYPDPDLSIQVTNTNDITGMEVTYDLQDDAGSFVGAVDYNTTSVIAVADHFCYDDGLIDISGVFGDLTEGLTEYDLLLGESGVFSGDGVTSTGKNEGFFDPSVAHDLTYSASTNPENEPTSSHSITFTYIDQFGCENEVMTNFYVEPRPQPEEDAIKGFIQFEALCLESPKTAKVVMLDPLGNEVTDYSQYTYDWDLAPSSINPVFVNNSVTFDDENISFTIAVTVIHNNTGCSILKSESETQGFPPTPTFTYVGITANSAAGLDIYIHEDNPSLEIDDVNQGVDSVAFNLYDDGGVMVRNFVFDGEALAQSVIYDDDEPVPTSGDPASINITGLPAGVYTSELIMKTLKGCDIEAPIRTITILPEVTVLETGYEESFEAGSGWYIEPSDESGKVDDRVSSWEITSEGGVWAPDASFAPYLDFENPYDNVGGMIVTDWDSAYYGNENSYVYSPAFDVSLFEKPALSFWHLRDFDSQRDGLVVQISEDDGRTWTQLGDNELTSGVEWYTDQGISAGPGLNNRYPEVSINDNIVGFADAERDPDTDEAIVDWKESRHAISGVSHQTNLVRLRFALASGSGEKTTEFNGIINGVSDGFAFDLFKIFDKDKIILVEQFSTTESADSKSYEEYIQIGDAGNGVDHTYDWDLGDEGVWINYYTDLYNDEVAGTIDPINARNKVDPSTRATYYGVTDVPTTRIAGVEIDYELDSNPEDFGNGFDAIALEDPDFQIPLPGDVVSDPTLGLKFTDDPGADNIEVTATFVSEVERTEDVELGFYFAVVEKEITGVTSGAFVASDVIRNALRIMLPGPSGYYYRGPLAVGQEFTYSVDWEINNVYDPQQIRVIAFVQYYNHPTKGNSVEQANFIDVDDRNNVEVGITDQLAKNGYQVYPNPSDEVLNLKLEDIPGKDVYYKISDQAGREVLRGLIHRDTKSPSPINTNDLPSGLYIIQLKSEDRKWNPRKIVIMH